MNSYIKSALNFRINLIFRGFSVLLVYYLGTMRQLKLYLDTSVISFMLADDSPVYKEITHIFFNQYINEYDVFISEVVLAELQNTQDSILKQKLFDLVQTFHLQIYGPLNNEINSLADAYIKNGAMPKAKIEDALHVAFATYYDFDILLSWNFRHLANIKRQIQINIINRGYGYTRDLNLLNPMEVIDEK